MVGHTDTRELPPETRDPGGTDWHTDPPPLPFEVIILREWTERHIRELIKNEIKKSGGGGGSTSGYAGMGVPTVRAKIHPTSRPAEGGAPVLDTGSLIYISSEAIDLGEYPDSSNYTTSGMTTGVIGTFMVNDKLNVAPGASFLEKDLFDIAHFILADRPFLIPDIRIYKEIFPSVETKPMTIETTLDFYDMTILTSGQVTVETDTGETLRGQLEITGLAGRVDVEMSILYSSTDTTYYTRVNPIEFQRFVDSHSTDDTRIVLLDNEFNPVKGFDFSGYSDIQIHNKMKNPTLSTIPYKYPKDQLKNTQPWIEILDTDKEAT